MNDLERDALLIRIDERTRITDGRVIRIEEKLGIAFEDIAVLQDDMRRRESEAKTLREDVPSGKQKALLNSGVLTSILIAIYGAYVAVTKGQ